MLGDRETKAGAAIAARRRGIGLAEGLKQPSKLLVGHADAAVGDDEGQRILSGAQFEGDAALMGKFGGVAQQIEEALLKLGAVGIESAERCRADDLEPVAARRGEYRDDRALLFKQGRNVHLFEVEVHLARLDLRQ